jgi:hypothetical protein
MAQMNRVLKRCLYSVFAATFRIDSNDLEGDVPTELCIVFNTTVPAFYADCEEFLNNCPCCTYCCVAGEGCECRYRGTDLEYLCFQTKSGK